MKNILIPPGNDWHWMTLRENHLARQFAKNGWKVYWCNRSEGGAEVVYPFEAEKNVWVSCLGEWPKTHDEVVEILGIDNVDVVLTNYPFWNDFPIEKSLTWFDYIDYVDEWTEWEVETFKKADLVTVISSSLQEYLLYEHPAHRESVKLRNGCELGFLQYDTTPSKELEDLPHPIVGYIGGTNFWWDREAFRELIPHFTTIHAGLGVQTLPYGVHTYPLQDYEGVRSFIHALDCGVHMTIRSRTGQLGSPLKIYDYLGCGIPVVTSENREMREALRDVIDGFVPICGSFIEPVRQAIENDSQEKREMRVERMKTETWDIRFKNNITPLLEERGIL